MTVRILIGDMRERLRELPDNSVDSCVCDPPYHLTANKRGGSGAASESKNPSSPYGKVSRLNSAGFMGQQWDGGDVAFQPETWAEVLRVLKPGGHLVAFSGTRTYHRMAVAIEDAGFEVRDMIAWHYGSGFPKSMNVSKAVEAQVINGGSSTVQMRRAAMGEEYTESASKGTFRNGAERGMNSVRTTPPEFTATTDAAREWEGWGTALKPATEPICLARKPLSEKSIAANVLKHGTGGLNIDGCRIEGAEDTARPNGSSALGQGSGWNAHNNREGIGGGHTQGRWSANLCHDGSDEVVAGFPAEAGAFAPIRGSEPSVPAKGDVAYGFRNRVAAQHHGDSGSAARFFYCAKATTDERGEGNSHPTVKPVALMRWLVRLVTPKGGTVLDPFMGSGSTALACDAEQFDFIGCELSPGYAEIARQRIAAAAGMFADISLEHCGPSARTAAA